jgi:titin
MSDLGNTEIGVFSDQTTTGTIIGGTTQSARNIVSGNDGSAISIGGYSTAQGNYVGLNAAGSAAIPSATASATTPMINLNGTANIFGGTTVSARNYVAGGASFGIMIAGGTPFGGSSAIDNVVQGNCVGTNANCQRESGFGNAGIGIVAAMDAFNTLIGGTGTGEGNVVTGNGSGAAALGFSTFYPLNTSILGNSIYDNGGGVASNIGIDNLQTNDFVTFVNQNVTPNDANDIDYAGTNTGPNHYLNFPVLNSVTSTNGTATITYDLDINDAEVGATGYRVEFFANDSADASGHGEGQTYLGSDTVSGDVTGKQVTITLPVNVSGTKYISAVTTMTDNSTDGFGHSSEFAADVEANLEPVVVPIIPSILASTGGTIRLILLSALILLAMGVSGLYIRNRSKSFLQK